MAKARDNQLFTKICPMLVRDSAELVEELLSKSEENTHG